MPLKYSSRNRRPQLPGSSLQGSANVQRTLSQLLFISALKWKQTSFSHKREGKEIAVLYKTLTLGKTTVFWLPRSKCKVKNHAPNKTCFASCQPTLPLLGKLDLSCLELSFNNSVYIHSVHLYCSTFKWPGGKVVFTSLSLNFPHVIDSTQ